MRGNYEEKICQLAKSDLHSHAGRGGHKRFIEEWTGHRIAPPPRRFSSLDDMQQWYMEHIRDMVKGVEGQKMRWKAGFCQAEADHLAVMTMSFSTAEVNLVGGMESFMSIICGYQKECAPNTLFLPELTYDRACDAEQEADQIVEYLKYGYFRSLDICCDEFAQPIRNFKRMYQKAKEAGLILRAHVGELGTAEDVIEAVEELELDEVHHGIAAAASDEVMRYLAEHQIRLHVCPSSNVMLGVVESYEKHPIARLHRAGVPVTINTDDLLIFDQSVSQEYQNLYRSGCLYEEELEEIRREGLRGHEERNV